MSNMAGQGVLQPIYTVYIELCQDIWPREYYSPYIQCILSYAGIYGRAGDTTARTNSVYWAMPGYMAQGILQSIYTVYIELCWDIWPRGYYCPYIQCILNYARIYGPGDTTAHIYSVYIAMPGYNYGRAGDTTPHIYSVYYSQTRSSVLPKNQDLVLLFKIWIRSSFDLSTWNRKMDFSSQASIWITKFDWSIEQ